MAIEIERKFLVTGTKWQSLAGVKFSQGYLSQDKDRTVRVRVAGRKGYLTIKGATQGATRSEFEYEIPLADAEALMNMCVGPVIEKIRRAVVYQGFTWEIDEFFGDNAGLVVAEIELESEDQTFDKPDWVGEEVTHDARYYNSNLSRQPYNSW